MASLSKTFFFVSMSLLFFILSGSNTSKKQIFYTQHLNNSHIEFDTSIEKFLKNIDRDSILSTLQYFETLETRYISTPQIQTARDWIVNKFRSYGYTDISLHKFNLLEFTLHNIIVTKRGTRFPNMYFIIQGHYDSINHKGSLEKAPGINDNGSGIALILEAARALAGTDAKYSIKFICFSAEEVGLIGSKAYVNSIVVPGNLDIRLVFNIDQIGGVSGRQNTTVVCERDENDSPSENNAPSAEYADTLATLTKLYTNLNTKFDKAYASDYVPFEQAGYTITGYYEAIESNLTHSDKDLLQNIDLDYIVEITKGALASIIYFAKIDV